MNPVDPLAAARQVLEAHAKATPTPWRAEYEMDDYLDYIALAANLAPVLAEALLARQPDDHMPSRRTAMEFSDPAYEEPVVQPAPADLQSKWDESLKEIRAMADKVNDSLLAENASLRARIAALEAGRTEALQLLTDTFDKLNPDNDFDAWTMVRITKSREALAGEAQP